MSKLKVVAHSGALRVVLMLIFSRSADFRISTDN